MTARGCAVGVVLALLSVGSVGCRKDAIQIPNVPELVATTESQVMAAAVKAQGILEAVGLLAEDLQTLELRLAGMRVVGTQQVPIPNATVIIPRELHVKIDGMFHAFALKALQAVDAIESRTVTTWDQLRGVLDPVLAEVEVLASLLRSLVLQGEDGVSMAERLNSWTKVAGGLLKLIPGGA